MSRPIYRGTGFVEHDGAVHAPLSPFPSTATVTGPLEGDMTPLPMPEFLWTQAEHSEPGSPKMQWSQPASPDRTPMGSTASLLAEPGGPKQRSARPLSSVVMLNSKPPQVALLDDIRPSTPLPALQQLHGIREIAFIFSVCQTQFMCQAGLSSCLAPLDILAQHFDLSPGQSSWLISGFSLTCGTLILVSGRLGDVLVGHRRMVLIGWFWFAAWSVIAGFSVYSDYLLLVISRTMMGVGPAILLPNGLALLGAYYPPGKRKTLMFSLFGFAAPMGALVGGVGSAAFSQYVWWPWSMWVNGMWCAVLFVLSAWALPHPTSPLGASGNLAQTLSSIDLGGSILGVTGLILVNVAFNEAPTIGWNQAWVITLVVIGFLLVGLFFAYELRVAEQPLLTKHVMNASTAYMLSAMGAGWASFTVWLYYGQWRIYSLRHQAPIIAAVQFLPCPIAGGLAALSMGWILPRIGPGRTLLISMIAFTAGPLLSAVAPLHQSYFGLTMVSLIVMPIGMDLSMPSATIILSNVVGAEQQGVVASLVCTVINYTGALSLGLAATIDQHTAQGPPGDDTTLQGYRAALYFAVGLGTLSALVALVYMIRLDTQARRAKARPATLPARTVTPGLGWRTP